MTNIEGYKIYPNNLKEIMNTEVKDLFEKKTRSRFSWFSVNRNFLSFSIFQDLDMRYDLLDVFVNVLFLSKERTTAEKKKIIMSDWIEYAQNKTLIEQNWKKPIYFTRPIDYIDPPLQPRHMLNFLYYYGYTAEEFIVSVVTGHEQIEPKTLLFDIMRMFTIIHYYIDEFNSHCSKIYTMHHYCPISSLRIRSDFLWHEYLINIHSYNIYIE